MTAEASRYQRTRLWCGILGIGSILVGLWIAVAIGLPAALDRLLGGLPPELAGALAAAGLGVAAAIVQAVPDAFAHRAELRHGQQTPGGPIGRYLVGALQSLGGLATAGALVGLSVRIAGDLWWLPAAAAMTGLAFVHVVYPLAPARRVAPPEPAWLDAIATELSAMKLSMPNVVWYDHGERSLAGGWSGVGPLRTLFVATSLASVPPRIAAGLIAREIGHLHLAHRATTIACTIGWIVAGLAIAGWLAGDTLGAAGVVTVTAATMSTWCWLGLLGLWPSLGRRQVYAADRFAAERLPSGEGRAMLDALADRNLPDPSLPAATAFVFHPIPPMDRRRLALEELSR